MRAIIKIRTYCSNFEDNYESRYIEKIYVRGLEKNIQCCSYYWWPPIIRVYQHEYKPFKPVYV